VTQPRIAAFARLANGNIAPARVIEGQISKLSRTMHGIFYDAVHDEVFVPVALAGAVLVFRGDANGAVAPIRVLQGPKTQIVRPDTLTVDVPHDEVIVASGEESYLVFPRGASGDVAPTRVVGGPKTGIAALYGLAVDPERNLIIAQSRTAEGLAEQPDTIRFFDRQANGDVEPRYVLGGPHTGILKIRQIEVDPARGWLFVAVPNNVRAYDPGDQLPTQWDVSRLGFIGVWRVTDSGDVPPRAAIKGPVAGTVWPMGLAFNASAGELYYVDMVRNGLYTFGVPELFRAPTGTARR
jgi:hypothetical protein